MKLYGKNPVLERLKSNPKSIQKIYLQQGHVEGGYIRQKAKKWGITIHDMPASKLLKLVRNLNAQGIVAEIEDFQFAAYDDVLATALQKGATLIFLDGLNDPQNLGVIIRSLSCMGGFALVLPAHHSVDVTSTVLRIACGGENHMPIAKVTNMALALRQAKEQGFWLAGSVVEGGKEIFETEWPFPLALVIGSEQKGMRPIMQKHLDLLVSIPMNHERLSMNAAQATTILGYEILRQRKSLRPT